MSGRELRAELVDGRRTTTGSDNEKRTREILGRESSASRLVCTVYDMDHDENVILPWEFWGRN